MYLSVQQNWTWKCVGQPWLLVKTLTQSCKVEWIVPRSPESYLESSDENRSAKCTFKQIRIFIAKISMGKLRVLCLRIANSADVDDGWSMGGMWTTLLPHPARGLSSVPCSWWSFVQCRCPVNATGYLSSFLTPQQRASFAFYIHLWPVNTGLTLGFIIKPISIQYPFI